MDAQPISHCIARLGHALKLHRGPTFGEVSNATNAPETGSKSAISANGMALAVNYLTSGGAVHSACSNGKGGARNRADRESHALSSAQVDNLIAAARHADLIGLPFTRMISIHWEAAGVPLDGMAKATGRFTDFLTKALARHGSGTALLWAHENGESKGGHLHLLVHAPADLVLILTGLQISWLRRITGRAYRKRVIRSDPIGGRLGLEIGNPDLHASNRDVALAYVLKGADAAAAAQFGLERLEPGGLVIGKRCGWSQNIGAKARREFRREGI